jgi:hypothetical protein
MPAEPTKAAVATRIALYAETRSGRSRSKKLIRPSRKIMPVTTLTTPMAPPNLIQVAPCRWSSHGADDLPPDLPAPFVTKEELTADVLRAALAGRSR